MWLDQYVPNADEIEKRRFVPESVAVALFSGFFVLVGLWLVAVGVLKVGGPTGVAAAAVGLALVAMVLRVLTLEPPESDDRSEQDEDRPERGRRRRRGS